MQVRVLLGTPVHTGRRTVQATFYVASGSGRSAVREVKGAHRGDAPQMGIYSPAGDASLLVLILFLFLGHY